VLIAGGGTGGHVYPGIAVAESVVRIDPGAQVLFVGGRQGLEALAVPEAGFRLRMLMVRGFPRRQWWLWPGALFANVIGFAQALREFGLDGGRPTVFVSGGSRGAHRINDAALDAMRRLKGRVDVQFILQTGREDFEWAKRTVEQEALPARVLPYLRRIHMAY